MASLVVFCVQMEELKFQLRKWYPLLALGTKRRQFVHVKSTNYSNGCRSDMKETRPDGFSSQPTPPLQEGRRKVFYISSCTLPPPPPSPPLRSGSQEMAAVNAATQRERKEERWVFLSQVSFLPLFFLFLLHLSLSLSLFL